MERKIAHGFRLILAVFAIGMNGCNNDPSPGPASIQKSDGKHAAKANSSVNFRSATLTTEQNEAPRGVAIIEDQQRRLDAERAEQAKSYSDPLPQVTIGILNQDTPAVEVIKPRARVRR